MEAVVTLVSHPDLPAVTADMAAAFGTGISWLAPGIACDIAVRCEDPIRLQAEILARLGSAPVDAAVLPLEGRRKRLLVADMDSTIITCECLDELADQAGLKPRISAITERAMRGELDFESAIKERVGLLAGLDVAALQRTFDQRVRLTSGARELVLTMRAHGAQTELVSGGFTFFTERVRDAAGFHRDYANRLEIRDDRLTGRVVEPILGREGKLAVLDNALREFDLPREASLAVGDGANDLGMIQRAGLGVAFHAKPIVATAARAGIHHGDLTALLYLQGYPRSAFVS
jgi:phosphoserine phosphatase